MAALQDLNFKNWSVSDKTNTLNGRIWNGAIRFTVFPKDRSGGSKPLLSLAFDQNGQAYVGLMRIINKLQSSPLGTKIPMSKTQWDPNSRTRKNVWVLTMEKDSEMVYKITMTDCLTNASFTFPIVASQSITVGSEVPNKSSLSEMGIEMFKTWLNQAHMYSPMTADKPSFGGHGGGSPRPGATPASAAVAPQVSGDSEDLPF